MTGTGLLVVLAVDPNLVRPGWSPLVVTLLLGAVLFFLARSMMRQFRKIDVPADSDASDVGDSTAEPGDQEAVLPQHSVETLSIKRPAASASADDDTGDSR